MPMFVQEWDNEEKATKCKHRMAGSGVNCDIYRHQHYDDTWIIVYEYPVELDRNADSKLVKAQLKKDRGRPTVLKLPRGVR